MATIRASAQLDAKWTGGNATQQASQGIAKAGTAAKESGLQMASLKERSRQLEAEMRRLASAVAAGNENIDDATREYDALQKELTETKTKMQQLSSAADDVDAVGASATRTNTAFGGLTKGVALAAAGFAAVSAGAMALGRGLVAVTSLAAEQERVERQLAATLESTGGAAGMSAEELKTLASELQNVTTFGDEAIIASESLLLTFTAIGRDVFPRAQTAILDTATAMETDLKSATLQIGKALNDPIRGLSALAESGIQFTDAQRAMVTEMVKAGDVVGAQTLILKELETQFGGSAAAAADTFGGRMTQVKNIIGDVGEIIGQQLTPALKTIAEETGPAILDAVQELSPEIDSLGQAASDAANAMVPLIQNTGKIINAFRIGNRVARAFATAGLSELIRYLKEAEKSAENTNDDFANMPPHVRAAHEEMDDAAAAAARLERANRELTAGSSRGGLPTVAAGADNVADSVGGMREVVYTANGSLVRFGDSMQRMADAHDQFEPAANAATGAIERETAAVEQLFQGFEKLNPAISGGFVEALNLTDGELTGLQTATQDADAFILNLGQTSGATAEELGYLALATGDFTQAQIDAAIKSIEFETRLGIIRQRFADGEISVYQMRDAVRSLIDEMNGLTDKTVTVTVNTVQNGQVVTNTDTNSGGLYEYDNPPGNAAGGPVSGGRAYMVGEAGPELFVPPIDGRILSNSETRGVLNGTGGGSTTIGNINIHILQPNASPQQIAAAVADGIGRGVRR